MNGSQAPVGDRYKPLRNAFARAAPGLIITDLKGNVLDVNDAFVKIVDRTPEEIVNANIFDLTHPEDQSRHQALLEQLLASRIPSFIVEKRYVRPDGTSVWVRNSVTLMGEEEAGPRHLISICEDISQRKQAEQALKHQEQMAVLGRLISSIVHEINNPLDSGLNLLFLAQQSANLEEARKYLQLAEEELRRVVSITAQGLQFQRQPSAPTEVDVAELFRSVVMLFKGRLDKAGVHVEFGYLDAPKLICFPGEIRQAFINLIGNAIDSMTNGGELKIKVRPGIDWRTGRQGVRITIADTGHGMDAFTRRRIYQAFFTTKGSEGSGLGLWVTANIVNKHQGSIHVRSRTLAGFSGTVFRVIFPYSGAEGKTPGLRDESIA